MKTDYYNSIGQRTEKRFNWTYNSPSYPIKYHHDGLGNIFGFDIKKEEIPLNKLSNELKVILDLVMEKSNCVYAQFDTIYSNLIYVYQPEKEIIETLEVSGFKFVKGTDEHPVYLLELEEKDYHYCGQ